MLSLLFSQVVPTFFPFSSFGFFYYSILIRIIIIMIISTNILIISLTNVIFIYVANVIPLFIFFRSIDGQHSLPHSIYVGQNTAILLSLPPRFVDECPKLIIALYIEIVFVHDPVSKSPLLLDLIVCLLILTYFSCSFLLLFFLGFNDC
jgi:hypothetical protein